MRGSGEMSLLEPSPEPFSVGLLRGEALHDRQGCNSVGRLNLGLCRDAAICHDGEIALELGGVWGGYPCLVRSLIIGDDVEKALVELFLIEM